MARTADTLVSIIIPTYNSEKHIRSCLDSLHRQPYKHIEIIVVDQSSSDQTTSLAKKMGARLAVLPKPKFYSPPTASRNKGAKLAKGSILYHLDSDMIVSPRLISEIVDTMKNNPDIGALVVHEQDKTHGFWSKCKALERKSYWGNDNIESARVVRKEIFIKVDGYDEKLNSGEDFDIHRRYKGVTKIAFCKNVVYHNLGELHFWRMIKKKYSYGKTATKYFNKHAVSGKDILLEQGRCFLKNYKLFLSHPVLGSGAILLKCTEFGAGGVGALVSKK